MARGLGPVAADDGTGEPAKQARPLLHRLPATGRIPGYAKPRSGQRLRPSRAVPGPSRDRNRLAGSTRLAALDVVVEHLAYQQHGLLPRPMPRAGHRTHERAGSARSARSATVTLSRIASLVTLPAPAAGRTRRDARPTQRRASSRDTPSARPVRGRPWKADGAHRPS